eukprot:Gb_03925 [translate_table: standard]
MALILAHFLWVIFFIYAILGGDCAFPSEGSRNRNESKDGLNFDSTLNADNHSGILFHFNLSDISTRRRRILHRRFLDQERNFRDFLGISLITYSKYPSPPPYHVFVNHRGPDSKNTLASLLFHHSPEGLRVFVDAYSLQPGDPLQESILHAIRTASVHVVIFSKKYVESKWCLMELLEIRKTGAPIIPVFYDVQPSDLRNLTHGVYAQAFKEKQDKYGHDHPDLVQDWKDTLRQVSYLQGLIFDSHNPESCSRDQCRRPQSASAYARVRFRFGS